MAGSVAGVVAAAGAVGVNAVVEAGEVIVEDMGSDLEREEN
jgi:hypothetical protein